MQKEIHLNLQNAPGLRSLGCEMWKWRHI